MRRYRCDLSLDIGQTVEIDGELFKHTIVVCRNQEGAKFELLSGEFAYLVEVESVQKKTAGLRVLEIRKIPDLPRPYIHLVLANPKVQVLEAVLEKSVEIGVRSIFLLLTENSFFKSLSKMKLKKQRLEKIITQAMQQSNRHEDLKIESPMSLADFLERYKATPNRLGYVLYARAGVDQKFEDISDVPENAFLLVGPEGGLNSTEVSLAESYGFKSLSLGHQILRVETACVAGVSILKSKLQIW